MNVAEDEREVQQWRVHGEFKNRENTGRQAADREGKGRGSRQERGRQQRAGAFADCNEQRVLQLEMSTELQYVPC